MKESSFVKSSVVAVALCFSFVMEAQAAQKSKVIPQEKVTVKSEPQCHPKLKNYCSEKFYKTQKLTPETQKLIKHIQKFLKFAEKCRKNKSNELTPLEFNRRVYNKLSRSLRGPLERIRFILQFYYQDPKDKRDIPLKLYQDGEKPSNDLVIFVHGGGWTNGDLESHEYLCRKLTKILQKDVLAIDYRLAPENPYPAPIDDIIRIYKKYSNSEYGRVILCGEGSGANLCASACLKIKEKRLPRPHASILLYPALSNDFNSQSYKTFGNCEALTAKDAIIYTNNYTGGNCQIPKILSNKSIFPILENDTDVFPREIVVTAGYDVLYDGQFEHVNKMLNNERNDLTWLVYQGFVHGFMNFGKYHDKHITQVCQKIKKCLDHADEKE